MRRIFCILAFLVGLAHAGEPIRFEAATGPAEREMSVHGYVWNHEKNVSRLVDLPELGKDGKTVGDALASLGAASGCGISTKEGKGLLAPKSGDAISLGANPSSATGVLLIHDGKLSLHPRADLSEAQLAAATHAIEVGPLLVHQRRAVENLGSATFERKTVLLTSDSGDFAILYVPSSTDAGLAQMLADKQMFPRFEVATATVLARGLHSGLWYGRGGSVPFYLREVNPVSVSLAILPKPTQP